MPKKTSIIGGMIQQYYHTIPDDKDYIVTSPNKESIFQFLSQIGYHRFPEFVRDILLKVERHTLVDITDGPGDEKQDILTLTPSGERCLTQCKHSANAHSTYNGDELDSMVMACLRKKCKHAIMVTNTDLTPQAKRYVTDKEYTRGTDNPAYMPTVDYWNDTKIWNKIKNNSDILNKWFGHLGQTHGLRNFRFQFALQKLPVGESMDEDYVEAILNQLIADKVVLETDQGKYKGQLPDGIVFFIEKDILFPYKLNINYLFSKGPGYDFNTPLPALIVEASMPNEAKYVPGEVRRKIVIFLLQSAHLDSPSTDYYHIVTSQATSFVFLHDIGETRQITLNNAETFVQMAGSLVPELDYVSLDSACFTFKTTDDEDDTIYLHKPTNTQVILLYEQPMNPHYVYEQQNLQLARLNTYQSYVFKAVRGVDKHLLMRVRRVLENEWLALQYGDDSLVWGYPHDVDAGKIRSVEAKLNSMGLTVLCVKDKNKILTGIKDDMPPPLHYIISQLSRLSYPVNLLSRIFWLLKDLPGEAIIDDTKALKLLAFKYYYESLHGFDNMYGKTEIQSNTLELPNLLADIMSFRGDRMLDIGILNKPYSVNVRFRQPSTEDGTKLALGYLSEFMDVYQALEAFVVTGKEINFDLFQKQ